MAEKSRGIGKKKGRRLSPLCEFDQIRRRLLFWCFVGRGFCVFGIKLEHPPEECGNLVGPFLEERIECRDNDEGEECGNGKPKDDSNAQRAPERGALCSRNEMELPPVKVESGREREDPQYCCCGGEYHGPQPCASGLYERLVERHPFIDLSFGKIQQHNRVLYDNAGKGDDAD